MNRLGACQNPGLQWVNKWKNPSTFTEMICFSQKPLGFYSSNGLFKVNTRKIPLSNNEHRGGYVFGTGWVPQQKTDRSSPSAHRFCFGAESSGGEVGDTPQSNGTVEKDWQMQQKAFCPFQKRFKVIFKKGLDIFFSTPPKFNMESEKNHLFNIFPIPILGFHVSFRRGVVFK